MSTYISSKSNGTNKTIINNDFINILSSSITSSNEIEKSEGEMAHKMAEASIQKNILSNVGELVSKLTEKIASSFNVDQDKISKAFKFNIVEDEVKRLFTASSTSTVDRLDNYLRKIGYEDLDYPSMISLYFKDSKEKFIEFLNNYNDGKDEENQIKYTDITGIFISSVKIKVDAVSNIL